jgi:acyl carrier protein
MTTSVFEEVRRIVADIFNVPLEEVNAGSSSDVIDSWDSLQHLNLVLALEQSFEMEFTPEEIEKMLSVESIVRLLEAKRLLEADGW